MVGMLTLYPELNNRDEQVPAGDIVGHIHHRLPVAAEGAVAVVGHRLRIHHTHHNLPACPESFQDSNTRKPSVLLPYKEVQMTRTA